MKIDSDRHKQSIKHMINSIDFYYFPSYNNINNEMIVPIEKGKKKSVLRWAFNHAKMPSVEQRFFFKQQSVFPFIIRFVCVSKN